jgi:hypothetical protein
MEVKSSAGIAYAIFVFIIFFTIKKVSVIDPRYPFHGRLSGSQSRSGHCEEEKNLLLEIEPRTSSP